MSTSTPWPDGLAPRAVRIPPTISRAVFFAGEVGSPRLLKLFARLGIKTAWFIPGHSVETFPAEMKAVAEAGHEIGIHGYSHENLIAMTREQEMAVLDKCIDLVNSLMHHVAQSTGAGMQLHTSRHRASIVTAQ
jgi:peptidoglycan/xylan/chitin deacetylase (PgdA/CDA1 family)